jgi:hypothetical protein
MSDDVLQNFKNLPDDIKRIILRKFQKIKHRENRRHVKCLKLIISSPLRHALFQSDGIKLLFTPSQLECGVEKTRGFGLRYGVKVSGHEHITTSIVSPTSRAFTINESERIIRALCNIVHYVLRINNPQDAFVDIMKTLCQSIKTNMLQGDTTLFIPPRHRQNARKAETIVNSIFDCKRVMLWD